MKCKVINWKNYFENTKNYPPAPLLVKAMEYVKVKTKAIDIGGGSTLKDTKYLLSQGFNTTIIDKEKTVKAAVQKIQSEKLKFFLCDFANFDFPVNEYDLAAAIYSLPFVQPSQFNDVFESVIKSLVTNGIFCGQFFGIRDSWCHNSQLTFLSKKVVLAILGDMEIIHLDEKEFEGKTADSSPKHWHVYNVIARKK